MRRGAAILRLSRAERAYPPAQRLRRVVESLEAGKLVAFPTDTFYGIAADPCSRAAVRRLFGLKGRKKPPPLIAANLEQVLRVAVLKGIAARLGARFWPGPLTLVLPALPGQLDEGVVRQDTVAIRIPRSRIARALAAALGRPITATSANRSGKPPARSAQEVARFIPTGLDLIVDAGRRRAAHPSTIVRVARSGFEIVREGAVSRRRIQAFVDRERSRW